MTRRHIPQNRFVHRANSKISERVFFVIVQGLLETVPPSEVEKVTDVSRQSVSKYYRALRLRIRKNWIDQSMHDSEIYVQDKMMPNAKEILATNFSNSKYGPQIISYLNDYVESSLVYTRSITPLLVQRAANIIYEYQQKQRKSRVPKELTADTIRTLWYENLNSNELHPYEKRESESWNKQKVAFWGRYIRDDLDNRFKYEKSPELYELEEEIQPHLDSILPSLKYYADLCFSELLSKTSDAYYEILPFIDRISKEHGGLKKESFAFMMELEMSTRYYGPKSLTFDSLLKSLSQYPLRLSQTNVF